MSSKYESVSHNGWKYLTVIVAGVRYFLGRTGKDGHCQDLGRMNLTLDRH